MRLVTDSGGTRYEVLDTDSEGWTLRAVVSGRETTLEPDALEPVEPAPLERRGLAVEQAVAEALEVHDLLGLGILQRLRDDGPTGVEALLTAAGPCERELSGRLADLRVAGLVRRDDQPATSRYALTDAATDVLRDGAEPDRR